MNALTLPYSPTVNHIYKPRGWGCGKRISEEVTAFRAIVSVRCNDARRRGDIPQKPIAGRLAVTVAVRPPDRRRRDLDNLGKSLLDALTKAGVWLDDDQIDILTFRRCEPIKGGACIVSIEPIPAQAAKE